jgi:hypothetical protein
MKTNRLAVMGVIVIILAVLAAAGILWLGEAPVTPPTQTINQVIPDDHIPR